MWNLRTIRKLANPQFLNSAILKSYHKKNRWYAFDTSDRIEIYLSTKITTYVAFVKILVSLVVKKNNLFTHYNCKLKNAKQTLLKQLKQSCAASAASANSQLPKFHTKKSAKKLFYKIRIKKVLSSFLGLFLHSVKLW